MLESPPQLDDVDDGVVVVVVVDAERNTPRASKKMCSCWNEAERRSPKAELDRATARRLDSLPGCLAWQGYCS